MSRPRRTQKKKKKQTEAPPMDFTMHGLMRMYRSMPKHTKKYVKWATMWASTVIVIVVGSAIFGDTSSSSTLEYPG